MKRQMLISFTTLLVFCVIFTGCQKVTSPTSDPSQEPTEAKAIIKLMRYTWDGWGISTKTVNASDLGYRIIDALKNLKETGETVEKISDDVLKAGGGQYPVERGTLWIECENKIYRLSPDLSQIYLVETHFGAGKVLEMTDELNDDIGKAWFYAPYDYYKGTYKNGDKTVALNNVFPAESTIQMSIKNIQVETNDDPQNKITIELKSTMNQTITVKLHCQRSDDNLARGDSKKVELIKDVPTTVELTFGGWQTGNYWIYLSVENTRAEIKIEL